MLPVKSYPQPKQNRACIESRQNLPATTPMMTDATIAAAGTITSWHPTASDRHSALLHAGL
jgi:hypothetical protein